MCTTEGPAPPPSPLVILRPPIHSLPHSGPPRFRFRAPRRFSLGAAAHSLRAPSPHRVPLMDPPGRPRWVGDDDGCVRPHPATLFNQLLRRPPWPLGGLSLV